MTELPAPARRALFIGLLIGLAPGWTAAEQVEPPTASPVGGFVYGAVPQGPILSADTLDGILEELDLPEAEGLSLWERLLLWPSTSAARRQTGSRTGSMTSACRPRWRSGSSTPPALSSSG